MYSELDRLGRAKRVFSTDSTGNLTVAKRKFDPDASGAVVREYLLARFDDLAPRTVEREVNLMGSVVSSTLPNGSKTTIQRKGLTVTTTDPRGGVSVVAMDQGGRVVRTQDALGHVTQFSYGLFGRPDYIIDSTGHTTQMDYDASGNLATLHDPDTGVHKFVTDAFGQIHSEQQGSHVPTIYEYDLVGRITKRTDADGVSTFGFDTAAHGIGRLASDSSPDGVATSYAYDALGRSSDVARVIDGTTYKTHLAYDALGRVAQIQYPSSGTDFTIKNSYDAQGRLIQVSPANAATSSVPFFWKRDQTNLDEQIVQETFGNGVQTTRAYDPTTSRVREIKSLTAKKEVLQDLLYTYDENLNLASRTDLRQKATETFLYDALDRLCDAKVVPSPVGTASVLMADASTSGFVSYGSVKTKPVVGQCEMRAGDKPPSNVAYAYDALGNLLQKPGAGVMTYDPARPHAVTTSADGSFYYNDVGDQIVRPDGGVDYTSFHLPKKITKGARTVTFEYDAQHGRVVKKDASTSTTTHYVGGLYERKQGLSSVDHRYTVLGARGPVAVVTRSHNAISGLSLTSTRYIHPDHQGSTELTTDETGLASADHVERRSYDAFGAPRNTDWFSSAAPSTSSKVPELGFTGQEDDAELGMVNMRGRMYDPKLGRFLSADPFVQKPTYSQSLNRYAYVWNNPLTMTDPSGFGAAEGPPEGGGAPEPTTPTGKADDDFYDSLGDGGATGGGGSGVVDSTPTAMGGDAGPTTAEGMIPPSGSVTGGGAQSDPGQAQGLTDPFSMESGNGEPNNTGTGGPKSGSPGGDTGTSFRGDGNGRPLRSFRWRGPERTCFDSGMQDCSALNQPSLGDKARRWLHDNKDTLRNVALGAGVAVAAGAAVAVAGGPMAVGGAVGGAVVAIDAAATAVLASPWVYTLVTAGVAAIVRFGPNLAEVFGGGGGGGGDIVERALQASDLGLSQAVMEEVRGTVVDAGSTRIMSVEMIKGKISVGELRNALPNILGAARAQGVEVLQIESTFANGRLQSFAFSQAEQMGGTVSSAGGRDVMTFILRAGR